VRLVQLVKLLFVLVGQQQLKAPVLDLFHQIMALFTKATTHPLGQPPLTAA